ncbi:MAG: hypothetical protein DRJ01_08680 [Bacteroidetes bacterium]|nr:MAG: hypothetical protein DRJ01_08680 [Bacteroidota bacterium]
MSKIYLSGANSKTPKTRRLFLIIGVAVVSIFISIIIVDFLRNDYDRILFAITNLIYGSVLIFIGASKSYKKFNKFIEIDSQKIAFKSSALKRPKIINIQSIKQLIIKPALINCKLENGFYEMNLGWVSYKDIQEIKEKIRAIAKGKAIKIIE